MSGGMSSRARGRIVAAVVAAAAVASGTLLGGSAAGGTLTLHLHKVGDFNSPVYVDNAPGAKHLLFVVEQGGKIQVVRRGHKVGHPFLDISNRVVSGGEQGLLSVAFDSRYAKNRRFYVYYTNEDCTNGGACNIEVDSFKRSRKSPTRARRSSRHKIIEITHNQAGNHNGGQLQFHNGHLFLGPGDGGTQGDPENDAQRTDSLLGKILRIDPKPHGGYTVPHSNPFVGKPGRDPIYSLGLRNPWRFSFDRKNGDLWIGDVGFNTAEEIDRASPGQANGGNFGWHNLEGDDPCPPSACPGSTGTAPPAYVPPVHSYPHNSSFPEHGDVITGGYVARTASLRGLQGDYMYSDNEEGDLRAYDPGTDQEFGLGRTVSFPSSFGEGRDGRLYVASLSGPVYRLSTSTSAHRSKAPRPKVGDGRGGIGKHEVGSFATPTYVAGAPGVKGFIYVVERAGTVEAVSHGQVRGTFIDIRGRVSTDGERGLLSIAFDPRYKHTHKLYAYYVNASGNIEVDQFTARSNRHAGKRRKVIEIPHPSATNHNGGTLAFGPRRKLFLATGDGGSTPQNGQDKGSLLGKLLRIEPKRHGGYRVPHSNPFVGRKGRNEIFALGFRNPFRFSFDRGRLLLGDVGQDTEEEVDFEGRRALRGSNFGWDHFEGRHVYNASTPRPHHRYRRPIFTYAHTASNCESNGGCAITGGLIVHGHKLRSLRGRYLYSDFYKGQLRSFVPHRRRGRKDRALGVSVLEPTSITDVHGKVFVTSIAGPVYRLVHH